MNNQLWWDTLPTDFFQQKEGKDPRFTFLDALPGHIRECIMDYLAPVNNIFIKEILEKQDDFRLCATHTEIEDGGFWRMRPNLYYMDERWGASINYKKRVNGSKWINEADAGPLEYMRGTPVPLWWIRMRDEPSPFYIIARTGPGRLEEGVIWGCGPDRNTLLEYSTHNDFIRGCYGGFSLSNNDLKQLNPLPEEITELEFRKNSCCHTLVRSGGCCGTLLPTSCHTNTQYWINHQVLNPHKDCNLCIQNNKKHFGDKAHLYENRCVYTRPLRRNAIWPEEYKFTSHWADPNPRLPYLINKSSRNIEKKQQEKPRHYKRKSREKSTNRPNRRVSKGLSL